MKSDIEKEKKKNDNNKKNNKRIAQKILHQV